MNKLPPDLPLAYVVLFSKNRLFGKGWNLIKNFSQFIYIHIGCDGIMDIDEKSHDKYIYVRGKSASSVKLGKLYDVGYCPH